MRESAQQAIRSAEKGYSTLKHLLSDPKHVRYLTPDQVRDFIAQLEELRKKLDGLQSQL